MVDMFMHPQRPVALLNYVTPRRGTAWVSEEMVRQGLDRLAEQERVPRVQYIEGLFPPQFGKSLRKLGLELDHQTPILMVQTANSPAVVPALPPEVTLSTLTDEQGCAAWQRISQNADADILTLGGEALLISPETASLRQGQQCDYALYKQGTLLGLARLSVRGESAHLAALALAVGSRTPPLALSLQLAALRGARERGAKVLFAAGGSEVERRLARDAGCVDFGSMVCYALAGSRKKEQYVNRLGVPVLTLL
jgi:hypothetical protein